jgi:hypothetical protein
MSPQVWKPEMSLQVWEAEMLSLQVWEAQI